MCVLGFPLFAARILAYADMGAWGGFYVSSPSWNSSAMTVVDVVQNQWFAANKRVDLIAHIGDISCKHLYL